MMAEVRAYECEECHVLGRARERVMGHPDPEDPHSHYIEETDYWPPDDWLRVSIERGDEDKQPDKVFCSEKCMGLHFRPIQRRKGANGGDDDQEEHPVT